MVFHLTASRRRRRSEGAGDLDDDGDPDVLAASLRGDRIWWHENLDGKGTFADARFE
jgi:hypothetical protein